MPSILRIAFGLLTFVAIAWQLHLHVDASANVVHFFRYFTNLSNLLAVLIRGATIGWYPYLFLNPATVGGYGGVAAYAIAIAVAFVLVGWALFAIGNRLRTRCP